MACNTSTLVGTDQMRHGQAVAQFACGQLPTYKHTSS